MKKKEKPQLTVRAIEVAKSFITDSNNIVLAGDFIHYTMSLNAVMSIWSNRVYLGKVEVYYIQDYFTSDLEFDD